MKSSNIWFFLGPVWTIGFAVYVYFNGKELSTLFLSFLLVAAFMAGLATKTLIEKRLLTMSEDLRKDFDEQFKRNKP
jgi:hypothetical protein